MEATPRGSSWLGPALGVALLWAPLPGLVAVWFAARAEAAADDGAFRADAARARLLVLLSLVFGLVQILAAAGYVALSAEGLLA